MGTIWTEDKFAVRLFSPIYYFSAFFKRRTHQDGNTGFAYKIFHHMPDSAQNSCDVLTPHWFVGQTIKGWVRDAKQRPNLRYEHSRSITCPKAP